MGRGDERARPALTERTLDLSVVVLPDLRWAEAAPRWRDAEQAGFTTVWTYDHLSWRSLRDGPWFGAVPLLTAAAGVTDRVRLGTLVASPNFRHPVPFAKDVLTLDEVSGGRLDLGLGSGGVGADATVLGTPAWSPTERAERFEEFVELLDLQLRQPATSWRGEHYAADDARTVPGCVQLPRVPFTIAAAGPRALKAAARHGQRWVTYGPVTAVATPDEWYAAVRRQAAGLDAACAELGRDPEDLGRLAVVGLELSWPTASVEAFADFTGRLAELGFTEVVLHWPRPDPDLPGPDPAVFELLVPAARPG